MNFMLDSPGKADLQGILPRELSDLFEAHFGFAYRPDCLVARLAHFAAARLDAVMEDTLDGAEPKAVLALSRLRCRFDLRFGDKPRGEILRRP